MSYKIKLGTISKYLESTAQPNTATWDEYDVVFKDGTDVVNPTITLSISYDTVKAYNYAYMLDRYYWITSKTMTRTGLCVIKLETDVLATYKTEIGAANLYILRSSTASDGTIRDNYYPIKGAVTYNKTIKQPYGPSTYGGGFYVVNVMGTASAGASTLWKMSPAKFRSFINNLYTNLDGFQPSDAADAIKKLIQGQPERLVSSALWFPSGVAFTTSGSERVKVANWDSGVDANLITDPVSVDYIKFNIPKHPQAASRGDYLNLSPYSIYTLTIPNLGCINIDTTAIIGASELTVEFRVDALSGTAWCNIYTDITSPVIANINSQFGVVLPLSGQSSGSAVVGGITSTLSATAAAVVTGGASLIAGAVASGIGTVVGAITGAASSTASSGNVIAPTRVWSFDSTHFTVVDEDNAHNGRPYCQVTTPATLGGFMIASRGDVDINGTLPEEQQIKAFLENGFYYE